MSISGSFELRAEQTAALNNVLAATEHHSRVILQAMTGFGKTIVAGTMIKGADTVGHRTMFTVPTHELVDQTVEVFDQLSLKYGVISSGYKELEAPEQPIQVVTPKSLLGRINKYGPRYFADFSMAFDDECHNAGTPTDVQLYGHQKKLEYRLGASGTPLRNTGAGLGGSYDVIVPTEQPEQILALGNRIVEPIVYSPPVVSKEELAKLRLTADKSDFTAQSIDMVCNQKQVNVDVLKVWEQIACGTQTIVFTATVKHAEALCDEFNAAGYPAAVLKSDMPKHERRNLVRAFRDKILMVLMNVDIVSEGFNVPGVKTVVFACRTKSLRKWLQAIGRSLRWEDGKIEALIIDCMGSIYLNGHPMSDRFWTLIEGSGCTTKSRIKQCKRCHRWVKVHVEICPRCGYEFGVRQIVYETQQNGTLALVGKHDAKPMSKMDIFNAEIKGAESFDVVWKAGQKAGYQIAYCKRRWEMIEAARNKDFRKFYALQGGRKKKKKAN